MENLGIGLKKFADEVDGMDTGAVTAGADAAKTIASIADTIPNSDGVVQWFTGEKSLSKFSGDMENLGIGLKKFADEVDGIDTESVTAGANAAKSIADVSNVIPNSDGMVQWFTGEKSLSKFGGDMENLGIGLKKFADEVDGIDPAVVTSAAGAAKSIAEMTNVIPNQDGMVHWFTGEKSLSKFGSDLETLGRGLYDFWFEVDGIDSESALGAVGVAKAIAEMTNIIPNSNGIEQWFAGEKSLSKFASGLEDLGYGIWSFDNEVAGIDTDTVAAAIQAAKNLADLTNTAPGDCSKLTGFGDAIAEFGDDLNYYFSNIGSIDADMVTISSNITSALSDFANNVKPDVIRDAADAIGKMTLALIGASVVNANSTSGFTKAISNLGKVQVNALLVAFKNAVSDVSDAGENTIMAYITGLKRKTKAVQSSSEHIARLGAISANSQLKQFYTAGANAATGFASGITKNTYLAVARAEAMAAAAAEAAKRELDEHSPSRVFYGIGDFAGVAFVNALGDYVDKAYVAGSGLASSARDGLSKAIGNIRTLVDGGMNMQPTIRPVLDLSDIRSGANSIGGMLNGNSSIGVLANIGAISHMMNQRSQNGANGEVVSAIDKLRRDVANMPRNSYNINGVTYDDGSNIAEAIKVIVREARVERRK